MSQKSDVIIWACHPRHRSHICFSGHCDLVVRKRQSWYWRSFRKGKTELATVVSSQGRDSTRYCRLVLAISSITSTKGHVLRFFIISMTTKMAWKQGLSTRGPYVSTLPVPKIYSPSNGSWSFWAGCCRVKWRSWTSPVEPSWRGKAVIRWLIVSHGHNQKSSKLTSSWSLSERSRLKSVKRGTAIVAFILLLTHQVFDSNPTREVSFRIESLYLWSSLVPNERLYRQGRELSSSHQRRNSKWTRQSRSLSIELVKVAALSPAKAQRLRLSVLCGRALSGRVSEPTSPADSRSFTGGSRLKQHHGFFTSEETRRQALWGSLALWFGRYIKSKAFMLVQESFKLWPVMIHISCSVEQNPCVGEETRRRCW